MWYNFHVPITTNAVDLTRFREIHILYDFYFYESSVYDNQMWWGITSRIPSFIFSGHPTITKYCDGYDNITTQAFRKMYHEGNQTWFYNQTHSIDISQKNGAYHIFVVPVSWSYYNDYTIVRIKKIWAE